MLPASSSPDPADSLRSSLNDAMEVERLRAELRTANLRAARYHAKNADIIAAVLDAAHSAYLTNGPVKPVKAPPKDRRRGKPEAGLWHLTDWQGGKKTVSYDLDVMDRRVRQFVDKALRITAIQRADHPVKHACLLFGGDMVENTTTFPGQVWEVHATTFDQIFAAANTMEMVVRAALENHDTVDVVCEPGNHGRIGRLHDGVPKGDNWDRVLYEIVRQRFKADIDAGRLTWTCEDHWHQRVQIGNYRAILLHGDEFRGFGGQIPMYGILRKTNIWKGGVLEPFHDAFVGHYHNANDMALAAGGEVLMTGSTESDNEYAREFVAASAKPSQRLVFVDPEKARITAKYRIDLD